VYDSVFLSGVRVGVSCVCIEGVYRVRETQYADMSVCVRVCVCECVYLGCVSAVCVGVPDVCIRVYTTCVSV